jgi:hypothetical protein
MMRTPTIAGCCLLVLLQPAAWSARVYSWTDAHGITHFSETPPADTRIEATVLEIEPAPAPGTPAADDYYSVVNQAARMEARRLEMERHRAEILKAEAQARQAEAAAAAAARATAKAETPPPAGSYYPLYPWRHYYGSRPYPSYRHRPPLPPADRPHRPRHKKRLVVYPDKP